MVASPRPLMFLLAGAASWLALGRRSVARYLLLRAHRLGLPLLVGLLLLSPFQAWIGASSRGPVEPFPDYAFAYFAGMRLEPTPRWLGDYGYHLWFLGFLLVYVTVSTPSLVWMRGGAGQRAVGRATALLARPLGLTWPLLPLVGSQLLLRPSFPAYRDWADFTLWFLYFMLGATLVAEPLALEALRRRGLRMLVPGAIFVSALTAVVSSGSLWRLEAAKPFDLAAIGYIGLRTAIGWCLVAAALAVGIRWLDRGAAIVVPLAEMTLPFYVLHHPVLVIVAAAIIGSPVGVWPKYAAIVVAGLAITLVSCALVERVPVLRSAFGRAAAKPSAPVWGSAAPSF